MKTERNYGNVAKKQLLTWSFFEGYINYDMFGVSKSNKYHMYKHKEITAIHILKSNKMEFYFNNGVYMKKIKTETILGTNNYTFDLFIQQPKETLEMFNYFNE